MGRESTLQPRILVGSFELTTPLVGSTHFSPINFKLEITSSHMNAQIKYSICLLLEL